MDINNINESILDYLIDDNIVYIMTYLSDKEKIKFLSLSKKLHHHKIKVNYNEKVFIEQIIHLSYFDMFTFVKIRDMNNKLPKSIMHLQFNWNFNQDIKGYIPNSITHLNFGENFNQAIKDCIPNSVTHLTFNHCFNQDIKDCIPNSVIHLTFGHEFNKNIKGCIPNSVTHLTLIKCFDRNIAECVPNSVTHLTLGWDVSYDYAYAKMRIFSDDYDYNIKAHIPNSI